MSRTSAAPTSYPRLPDVPHAYRRLLTAELFDQLTNETSTDARDQLQSQLIVLNVGVARTIARRYHRRNLDNDDIDQTAFIALIGAVRRFDPGAGHDFLAFAVPTIRGEIQRHFRDHGWTIRPPRRIQETQTDIIRIDPFVDTRERRSNKQLDELATLLGRRRADVSEALSARGCFSPTSLDLQPDPSRPTTLGTNIAADDDWVSRVETRSVLQPLVRRLAARDQRVLFLRYVEEWTQTAIGAELGVTQMQVSRILVRIHSTLRADLEETRAAS